MPEVISITIDGTKQEDMMRDLVEVVVDTNLFLPAMFTVIVNDEMDVREGKLKYTDSDTFKVGAEVKIAIRSDEIPGESGVVEETLIIGEITAIEPSFQSSGRPLLCVRGYDRLHHLARGKKTRTYGDANPQGSGIGEEQIINTIVQDTAAITGSKVDTSGLGNLKYNYVMQYNQTDLEFLWSRARMLGYQVYVEDKILCFQKADANRGEGSQPAKLMWGMNLTSFEPRLTTARQVNKALVTGWDPATKKGVTGTETSDDSQTVPDVGWEKKGSDMAKEAFGQEAEEVLVHHPVRTVDEAKVIAQARFAAAAGEFIQAEGVCRIGDPRLLAGRTVEIGGVGTRFSGKYYITEARHIWALDGYSVSFGVTGRTPYLLSYLLAPDDDHSHDVVQGVVTAKVTNLEDPEGLGRVQVMYPWLPKYKDADLSSSWARIAAPMAGKERGFLFLPEIDDEVLVCFEHGDVNYPYIVGVLWNGVDKPPQGTKSVLSDDKRKVNQRVLRSRSGHLIVLDDTDGEEQIIIQDKTGNNKIVINSKENSMTINVDQDLTIVAKGKTSIQSTGDMSLKSDGDISIECNNLDIKARSNAKVAADSGIDLNSSGQFNIKGAKVGINADGMAEIKSNGMLQVQSNAPVKIQGTPIMLN